VPRVWFDSCWSLRQQPFPGIENLRWVIEEIDNTAEGAGELAYLDASIDV
jgi:hypothetical protein